MSDTQSAAEVWAELKRGGSKPRKKRSTASAGSVVLAGLNKPVKSSKGKKDKGAKSGKRKGSKKKKEVVVPAFLQQATGRTFSGHKGRAAVVTATESKGEDTVGASGEPVEATPKAPLGEVTVKHVLTAIARDINCISDEVVGVRVQALKRLDQKLFGSGRQLTDAQLQDLYPEVMKPLLKRFADRSEQCRELSISLTTKFMQVILDLGFSLPYVMPAVHERLGDQWQYDLELKVFVRDAEAHDAHRRGKVLPLADVHVTTVVEPSEEVRLKLAKLLGTVLETATQHGVMEMVKPYLHHIILCTVAASVDPFPDLRVYGCGMAVLLCTAKPEVVKFYAPGMVRMLKLGLDHRHAKVRLAALDAVDAAVACEDKAKCRGAGTEAIVDLIGHRDENVVPVATFYRADPVINYFAKLGIDRNPAVRKRFVEMIGGWMLNLPDRIDHESRLMPFLVTAIGDDVPAVSSVAMEVVEALGIQYEKEHHDEVIERKQYGVDGDRRVDRKRSYPPPFTGRPRLGARLWVRTSSPRFVKVVLRELGAWVSDTKRHAARLIMVLMVYLEEHITHDVHHLLKCLFSSIRDPEIASEARTCAQLCGWFADPEAYIPLVLPLLRGDAVVPVSSSLDRVLEVLALILKAVRPSRMLAHIRPLLAALDSAEFTDSRLPSVRSAYAQVLAAIAGLLNGRIGAAVGATFDATGRLHDVQNDVSRLLRLLLSVYPGESTAEAVEQGLQQLAASQDSSTVQEVVSQHVPKLLGRLVAKYPDRLWKADSSQQSLLEQTLKLASPAAVAVQADAVLGLGQALLAATELGERATAAIKVFTSLLEGMWASGSAGKWSHAGASIASFLAQEVWGSDALAGCWLSLMALVTAQGAEARAESVSSEGEDGAAAVAPDAGAGAGAGQPASAAASTRLVEVEDVRGQLPALVTTLVKVCGSQSHTLRHKGLACLQQLLTFIEGGVAGLTPLLFNTVQGRLSDSREEVRLAAAGAMSGLLQAAQLKGSSEPEACGVTLLEFIAAGLRNLHVEGGSEAFNDAVTGVLFEAAMVDPEETADIVRRGLWKVAGGGEVQEDLSTPCADLLAHAELLITFRSRKSA